MDTVMAHQEITEAEKRQAQYQEAVQNGFVGTYEEFLRYRDYT